MRVLLLSRYDKLGASSRLRSYQFLPYLNSTGLEITVASFFSDRYVSCLYKKKVSIVAIIGSYLKRIFWLFRVRQFDMVWLEKEMLPWFPSWLELGLLPRCVPIVVDFDDAVFHRYDQHNLFLVRLFLGKKIDSVMRRAVTVTVGNDYLAKRASIAGARCIELIPTVVDVDRYSVLPWKQRLPITIGWIGSPSTAHYLTLLAPVFINLVKTKNIRVVAVGANQIQLNSLPIESKPWAEATEVSEIQQFDIGIMPLHDLPFERGKCGYKLIQYMACGIPVVASPVGVNMKLIQDNVNGFLAFSMKDWEKYLGMLCADPLLRQRLGRAGRQLVESEYSLQQVAPRLGNILLAATQRQRPCAE